LGFEQKAKCFAAGMLPMNSISNHSLPTVCAPKLEAAAVFREQLKQEAPLLALAPMQDVTDHGFIHLLREYGGADVCFAEYFRVTADSKLDPEILRCATENATGRPVVLQMIGNDVGHLVRTARELQQHPVAGIDLNLGCPAPRVFNKCAGGGLLTDPPRIERILGALREAITAVPFTVKTRIGVDDPELFETLLAIYARQGLDLLTVHGRTVREMYWSEVHYDRIARAVEVMDCPVLANGNVDSPERAVAVLRQTGAHGLMLGRGAIRNPWVFEQIRAAVAGREVSYPTGREVLRYVERLFEVATDEGYREEERVHRVKKHLNFLGVGVPPSAEFLHRMRRARAKDELFAICAAYLDHEKPMPLVGESDKG
jgi:nifR3 family TIM-barrel protein